MSDLVGEEFDALIAKLRASGVSGVSALKAAALLDGRIGPGGFEVSGLVLTNRESGERCLIDMGAVRWLPRDDFCRLMTGASLES